MPSETLMGKREVRGGYPRPRGCEWVHKQDGLRRDSPGSLGSLGLLCHSHLAFFRSDVGVVGVVVGVVAWVEQK